MSNTGFSLVESKKVAEYRLDILSIYATFWAATTQMLLLLASHDPNVVSGVYTYITFFAGFTALFVLLGGLNRLSIGPILSIVTFGKPKQKFEVSLLSVPFTYAGIGAVQFIILNYGPSLGLFPNIVSASFFTSGGVLEEWMFTFVLLGALLSRHLNFWASSIFKSVVFTTYHFFRYGNVAVIVVTLWGVLTIPASLALVAVFASSMVLCIPYRLTKRLWVNQFAHGFGNLTVGP